MDSMVLWPLFGVAAATIVSVAAVQDSGYRTLTYWLVIPPLLAILAACAHLGRC